MVPVFKEQEGEITESTEGRQWVLHFTVGVRTPSSRTRRPAGSVSENRHRSSLDRLVFSTQEPTVENIWEN